MQPFTLSIEQIVSISSVLIAEELSHKAKRHIDSITVAGWSEQTKIGKGGVELDEEEYAFCMERIVGFFGGTAKDVPPLKEATILDIAQLVKNIVTQRFEEILFRPAGGRIDSDNCRHACDHIFADAAAAANLFYGRRRMISMVAPHSLMGFVLTVLTPNLQQIPVLDARSMPPDELEDALTFGDVLVATPTLWRYILQQGITAPDNTMGVFFGEPMSAEMSSEMRHAGFAAQRELYGSTENGLIGWRDSPTDPFLLFDHWSRHGDGLYRLKPRESHFMTSPMDILQWTDDRRFFLSGRRDGAVQVGAVNVFPAKIAKIVNQHPAVMECVVKVSEYKDGGNRLVAHIRLSDKMLPTEVTVRDIDQWCLKNLRPQERPRIFHFEKNLEGL